MHSDMDLVGPEPRLKKNQKTYHPCACGELGFPLAPFNKELKASKHFVIFERMHFLTTARRFQIDDILLGDYKEKLWP